jgi:hypothetical protein
MSSWVKINYPDVIIQCIFPKANVMEFPNILIFIDRERFYYYYFKIITGNLTWRGNGALFY